jgi:hypothetical protein
MQPTVLLSSDAAADATSVATVERGRRVLATALGLGVVGDALLRDGFVGAAFPLFVALVVANLVSLAWQDEGGVRPAAAAWLAAAIAFATTLVWRDSDGLHFLNVVATVFSLGMAGLAIGPRPRFLTRLLPSQLAGATLSALMSAAGGAPGLVLKDAFPQGARGVSSHGATVATRSLILTIPLVIFFGFLLVNADPIFAKTVSIPSLDVELVMSHVLITGVVAWLFGGWLRGVFRDAPATPEVVLEAPSFLRLGPTEIASALGALNVLFGAFILVQLRTLIGGAEYVRATAGLTVAEYARRGFFELFWVTALVIPVVLVTRAVAHDARTVRLHSRLALPLIGLVGAMVASAFARLSLYVDNFGLTSDRLVAAAIIVWLAAVLAWMAFTVLRQRPALFVAGAVISGLVTIGVLDAVGPDRIVARTNIARAAEGHAVDLVYLAGLGGDAIPMAVRVTLDPAIRTENEFGRCAAASVLLRLWSPTSSHAAAHSAGWVHRNFGRNGALEAVGRRADELRAIDVQCRRDRLAQRAAAKR